MESLTLYSPRLVTISANCHSCFNSTLVWTLAGRHSSPIGQRGFVTNPVGMTKAAIGRIEATTGATVGQSDDGYTHCICSNCNSRTDTDDFFTGDGPFTALHRHEWKTHDLGFEKIVISTPEFVPLLDDREPAKAVRWPNTLGSFVAIDTAQFIKTELPSLIVAAGRDSEKLIALAEVLQDANLFIQAYALATQAAELSPESADASMLIGELSMSLAGVPGQIAAARLAEAEARFINHQKRFGESSIVLAQLSRVAFQQSLPAKQLEHARRAVALDANEPLALGALVISLNQQAGQGKGFNELETLTAAQGQCWLAHCWLARRDLRAGFPDKAVQRYRLALSEVPSVPFGLLQTILSCLPSSGHVQESLDLLVPIYDLSLHGADVGIYLLRLAAQVAATNHCKKLKVALNQYATSAADQQKIATALSDAK